MSGILKCAGFRPVRVRPMAELAGENGRGLMSRVIRFSKVGFSASRYRGLYEGIDGRGFLYSGVGTFLRPYDEGFSDGVITLQSSQPNPIIMFLFV